MIKKKTLHTSTFICIGFFFVCGIFLRKLYFYNISSKTVDKKKAFDRIRDIARGPFRLAAM